MFPLHDRTQQDNIFCLLTFCLLTFTLCWQLQAQSRGEKWVGVIDLQCRTPIDLQCRTPYTLDSEPAVTCNGAE